MKNKNLSKFFGWLIIGIMITAVIVAIFEPKKVSENKGSNQERLYNEAYKVNPEKAERCIKTFDNEDNPRDIDYVHLYGCFKGIINKRK